MLVQRNQKQSHNNLDNRWESDSRWWDQKLFDKRPQTVKLANFTVQLDT